MRKAKFAGSFYPSNKEELERVLDIFIKKNLRKVKGLIVPHAGYIYSGKIAGAAYGLLGKVGKVVLLGPSHQVPFYGVALDDEDYWETPLGKVKLFRVKELLGNNLFKEIPDAYEYEHNLEVQIPFLQKINSKMEILPLIVGEISKEDAKEIANLILKCCKDCVFIFSTDLSHFYNEEIANELDNTTIKIIENLDFNRLDKIDACGKFPILIAMNMCKVKDWKIRLIKRGNSAEASKGYDSVVGYAGLVID